MHKVRRFIMGVVAIAGSVAVPGTAAATEPAGPTVAPVPWPTAEVLDRCKAVVQTAHADYEQIVADAVGAASTIRVGLTSAAPFPLAGFTAKVCAWSDLDRDARIDPDEEPSVRAFFGPLAWQAGALRSSLTVADPGLADPTCLRVWIEASYPDGGASTKRSSIACLAASPPSVVPEVPASAWLSASALAALGGAFAWRSRRRPGAGAASSRRGRRASAKRTFGEATSNPRGVR